MRVLPAALLLAPAAGGGGAPIDKRIRWFIDSNGKTGLGNPLNTDFLLGRGRGIAHGVYPMGGGSIAANGTLAAHTPDPRYKLYSNAGLAVMPCFGGSMLPRAAYQRRHDFAGEVLAYVLKCKPCQQLRCRLLRVLKKTLPTDNFSGITLDWESHGDGGGDAHEFSAVWEAVAELLHAHGRTIGICVETGSPNVSHPWVPRTLPNDTIWHSYMMDWDYPLYIKWADVITNMATYPSECSNGLSPRRCRALTGPLPPPQ